MCQRRKICRRSTNHGTFVPVAVATGWPWGWHGARRAMDGRASAPLDKIPGTVFQILVRDVNPRLEGQLLSLCLSTLNYQPSFYTLASVGADRFRLKQRSARCSIGLPKASAITVKLRAIPRTDQ